MSNFIKDNDLMNGKGENEVDWITVKGNHIPIKDGETVEEVMAKRFDTYQKPDKENITEKSKFIAKLVKTLKSIKSIKLKELANILSQLGAVELKTDSKELLAEFDKFTGRKNVYAMGNSDIDGYNFKINNIKNLSEMIKNVKYDSSMLEKGKTSPQHKGVKEWHYFIGEIKSDFGAFDMVVNIRDKGVKQFVYEIALKKK